MIGLAYVGGCIALWLNERIGISIVWVASALNLWQNWLWQYEYPWDYFGQLFAVILIGMTLLCMFFLFIQRRGKSGWKLLDDDAEFWGVCKVLIGGYLLTLLFSFNIDFPYSSWGKYEIDESGGTKRIYVCNQSLFYTVTVPSWCRVEKKGLKGFKIKSDAGSTYLNFSFGQKSSFLLHYNANTTGKARDCRITVKSVLLEDEDVFVYNQKAYASYLRVNGNTSSESLNFSSGYDSETVSVTTDGEYEIEDLPSWCSISNQTKNSFMLSCSNNSSTSSRSGSFSVNAGSYSVRVNVSQAGKASYLRVNGSSSTQYYDVSASSQTKTFNVSSSDSYYVRNLPSWCSVTNKYSGSFGLKINANKSSYRSDWFTVECGGKSVRIYIRQAANTAPTGEIHKVWVDHNVYEDGVKGMRVHVKFSVYGMKGKSGQCALYFYDNQGESLRDINQRYRTSNGNVATHDDFTPGYENTIYNDFDVFMPYSELHITRSGSYKFDVIVWYGQKELAESSWVGFTYTL